MEAAVAGIGILDILLALRLVILHAVKERERKDEPFLVFPPVIRDVLPVHLIAHRAVPVHVPHQGIQEGRAVAHRIGAADEAADARSHDHVDRELVLFQIIESADRRRALGTTPAQDEGHRRPAFSDFIHPAPHVPDRLHVGRVQSEAGRRRILTVEGRGQQEKKEQKQISLHNVIHGCAGRRAGRRPQGYPRPGRRGWWR